MTTLQVRCFEGWPRTLSRCGFRLFTCVFRTIPGSNLLAACSYKLYRDHFVCGRGDTSVRYRNICILSASWNRFICCLDGIVHNACPLFLNYFLFVPKIGTGSVDECTYKLLTYGIPADQIPIKSSGIIKIADHKRFIAYCQAWEDAVFRNGVEYDGIYCPSSKDVLVGRGPRIKNHVGNEIYRLLLQSKFEQYNASSINQKREITLQVIGEVHAYGGRFLLPAKCCWIKADIETIRAKVSIAFRDVRKAMHAKKNRCYSNSVSMELSTDKNANFGCIWDFVVLPLRDIFEANTEAYYTRSLML